MVRRRGAANCLNSAEFFKYWIGKALRVISVDARHRLPIPDDWAFEDLSPHALRGRSRPLRVDAVSRGQPAKRGADRIEGRLTLGRLTGPCP